jgi:hypothetical protein
MQSRPPLNRGLCHADSHYAFAARPFFADPEKRNNMLSLNLLFSLAGDIVLPVWLLLVFAPGWRWTQRLATFAVPLLLAAIYGALFLRGWPVNGGGFASLAQVAKLFTSQDLLLAGWIHYLAFDLFVGAWQTRDALRLGLSRWLVAPCLMLTFLFGPLGLSLYLLVRLTLRKELEAQC